MEELHQMTLREIVRQAGLPSVLSEIAAYITELQIERANARAQAATAPASASAHAKLETEIRRLKACGVGYDDQAAFLTRVAGVRSRQDLDAEQIAKAIHAFARRADECERELEARGASVGPAVGDVPF